MPYPPAYPPAYSPAYLPAYHPAFIPTYVCHTCELHRQHEAKESANSIADLKAAWAQELAEVKRQAQEQQQQASSEAQVKLSAAQASRDKLQAQVDKLQESNGSLHKQLADAHGKVREHRVCLRTAWASALVHGRIRLLSSLAFVGVASVRRPTELALCLFCPKQQHLNCISVGALRCHH